MTTSDLHPASYPQKYFPRPESLEFCHLSVLAAFKSSFSDTLHWSSGTDRVRVQ